MTNGPYRNTVDVGEIDGTASGGASILSAAATLGNTIISSLISGSMPSAATRDEAGDQFLGAQIDSLTSPGQSSLVSSNRDDAGVRTIANPQSMLIASHAQLSASHVLQFG